MVETWGEREREKIIQLMFMCKSSEAIYVLNSKRMKEDFFQRTKK